MTIIPNASSTKIFSLTFLITEFLAGLYFFCKHNSYKHISNDSKKSLCAYKTIVYSSHVCAFTLGCCRGAVRHDHILKETTEWLFLELFLEKRYFFFQSNLNRCHLHIAIHRKHLIEDGFHRHPFHWQSSVFIAHIDHLTAYFPR